MQNIQPRNGFLHVKIELKEQPRIHIPDSAVGSVTPIAIPGKDKTEALVHESAVLAVVS